MGVWLRLVLQYPLHAQEFETTYGMYDIQISKDLQRISRDYVHHEKVRFIAPDYTVDYPYSCDPEDDYETSRQLRLRINNGLAY